MLPFDSERLLFKLGQIIEAIKEVFLKVRIQQEAAEFNGKP